MKVKFFGVGSVWNPGNNTILLVFPKEGYIETDDDVTIDLLRRNKFREEIVQEIEEKKVTDGLTPKNPDGLTPKNLDGLTPKNPDGLTPKNLDGLTPKNPDGLTPYVPKAKKKDAALVIPAADKDPE